MRTKEQCINAINQSSPYTLYRIDIPTYKTTLRVIRRLWGVGGSTFEPQLDRTPNYHRNHIDITLITTLSNQCHNSITTISQRNPIDITSVSRSLSHRYITSVSHRYNSITSVSHQFHIGITSVSQRYNIRYHISFTSVSHRFHIGSTSKSHWYYIGITSV